MKDTVDSQMVQQYDALAKQFDEAWNNNDAALFTKDAVLVPDTGPIYGREAIKEYYADLFEKVLFTNFVNKGDQYFPSRYRNYWQRDMGQR